MEGGRERGRVGGGIDRGEREGNKRKKEREEEREGEKEHTGCTDGTHICRFIFIIYISIYSLSNTTPTN